MDPKGDTDSALTVKDFCLKAKNKLKSIYNPITINPKLKIPRQEAYLKLEYEIYAGP